MSPVWFMLVALSGPLVAAATVFLGAHHVWWAMPIPLVVWWVLMNVTSRNYRDWNR